jgi:hypothetical protein
MNNPKLYIESVKERNCGYVSSSDIREATEIEIADAQYNYIETNICDHAKSELIVYDEPGWLYDLRVCGICGEGLGTV